jgi:hypothetical protein
MIIKPKVHKHNFQQPAVKEVLLASYKIEEGKMKYQVTTGKDKLMQRICTEKIGEKICGARQTYDLERVRV